MFQRIVQFKIYGRIDEKLTQNVQKAIYQTRFIKPKLITMHISGEGSLIQAKIIGAAIRNYATKHKVQLYCFGEDFVLNSGVYLMTVGDRNFASEYAMIGDFGYVQRRLGYKQLMENLNLEHKYIHSGEKKVKLSPYDDLKEDDVQWMQGQLIHREKRLKEEIAIQRQKKFTNKELLDKTLITSQEALENGLIDEIGTIDDIRHQFKGLKTFDILSKPLDFYIPAKYFLIYFSATFKSFLQF